MIISKNKKGKKEVFKKLKVNDLKLFSQRRNSTRGITLIALVITIIVLLILAGVTIAMLTGENGILTKSNLAKENTEQAAKKEKEKLENIEGILEIQTGEVPIPSGFYYVGGSKTTGLVISDKKEDEKKGVNSNLVGNQFVWIWVDETEIKLNRYTFDTEGKQTEHSDNPIEAFGYNYRETTIEGDNRKAKNINEFKSSVERNKGYYIARYEASKNVETGKVESKIADVWNRVTQIEASEACQNIYDNSYGVKSDLMNSYAWDTAISYIQKYSNDKYSRQKTLNNSCIKTGETKDIQCNINDMASNCFEWTTETYSNTNTPCSFTGGCFQYIDSYVSNRGADRVSVAYEILSFRPILYL